MSKNNYIRRRNKHTYEVAFYFECKHCSFTSERKDEIKDHVQNSHFVSKPRKVR